MKPVKRMATLRLLAAITATALLTGCPGGTLKQLDERLVTARSQVLALEYGGDAGADALTLGGGSDARRAELAGKLGRLAEEADKAAQAEAAKNAPENRQNAAALYRSAAVALWQMKRVLGSGPEIASPPGAPALSKIRADAETVCTSINESEATAEHGHCIATEVAAALGPAEQHRFALNEIYGKFKMLQNRPGAPLLEEADQKAVKAFIENYAEAARTMTSVRSRTLLAPVSDGYRTQVEVLWGTAYCNLDSARFVLSGVPNGSTIRANSDGLVASIRNAFNERFGEFRDNCPAFLQWVRQREARRLGPG